MVVASARPPDSSMTAASAVGPSSHGLAEEEMVVGAEVAVVEPGRNPRVLLEATQRRARTEVDQRQVGAVFHGSPDWRQNCADPNVHDRGAVLRVVGAERQS